MFRARFSSIGLGVLACLLCQTPRLLAQILYEDDFSSNTIANYEPAGGAVWKVEDGELRVRNPPADWSCLILKEKFWKGWTDYTYDLTVTPDVSVTPALFIYQVFRWKQAVTTARTDFFSILMDQDNVVGVYLDRFVGGVRSRPVPDTLNFAGAWKNEAKTYHMKVNATSTHLTGWLDDKQLFSLDESNLADGRIGVGVWGADLNFDNIRVVGPNGLAVEPQGKTAVSWGKLKRR